MFLARPVSPHDHRISSGSVLSLGSGVNRAGLSGGASVFYVGSATEAQRHRELIKLCVSVALWLYARENLTGTRVKS